MLWEKCISCIQSRIRQTKGKYTIRRSVQQALPHRARKATSSQMQNLPHKECMTPISKSHVKRRLSTSGLRGRVLVSKSLVRRGSKDKHLGWGKGMYPYNVFLCQKSAGRALGSASSQPFIKKVLEGSGFVSMTTYHHSSCHCMVD